MILNYIFSALAKPELATGFVEFLLRLFFSNEVRKFSAACIMFGRDNAGRLRKLLPFFAMMGAAFASTMSPRKGKSSRRRSRAILSAARACRRKERPERKTPAVTRRRRVH